MSLFMLGDKIIVHTRRYGGSSGGLGEPLVVEINGIGGIIVLRKGKDIQPAGTSVLVTGRNKPDRFTTFKDRVMLVDALYSYALAGEFPVSAKTTIPEIADTIEIPVTMAEPWHPLVEFGVKYRAIFEQEFSEVDPRLRGKIICGFPISEDGKLVLANAEAGWRQPQGRSRASFFVEARKDFQVWTWEGRTCIDGILVAGPHGRGHWGGPLVGMQYANPIGFGEDLFVLDVRGDLKPELAPDRSPPERSGPFHDCGPSWRRLSRIAMKAHGKLWEKIIERFGGEPDAEALWQLMALHRVHFSSVRRGFIWSHLLVPSINTNGTLFFRKFQQLGDIPFGLNSSQPFAPENDGLRVGVNAKMDNWHDINGEKIVFRLLQRAVLSMATLNLSGTDFFLRFLPPDHPEELGFTSIVFDRLSRSLPTMPFGSGLENTFAVAGSGRFLNKNHPITAYLLSQQQNTVDDPEFLFLNCLAGAVNEIGALEALANDDFANRQFNYNFSSLGYYFQNLDVNTLKQEHRPPYRCWILGKGFFEISQQILEKLARIQIIDWHRRQEPRHL